MRLFLPKKKAMRLNPIIVMIQVDVSGMGLRGWGVKTGNGSETGSGSSTLIIGLGAVVSGYGKSIEGVRSAMSGGGSSAGASTRLRTY